MSTWCSTAWAPTSTSTRVVTIDACVSTTSATSCATNPQLQVVVTFDDYLPGDATTSNECTATCGEGIHDRFLGLELAMRSMRAEAVSPQRLLTAGEDAHRDALDGRGHHHRCAGGRLRTFGVPVRAQSQSVKNYAMYEPVLRNASADLSAQLEYGTPSSYATCATAAQYQPGGSNAVNLTASIPSGYSVSVTSVAYWNGTQFVGTCPVPTTTPAPELVTPTATNIPDERLDVNPSRHRQSLRTAHLPARSSCLPFCILAQPTTSAANAAISPSVAVAVENSNGAILIDDY